MEPAELAPKRLKQIPNKTLKQEQQKQQQNTKITNLPDSILSSNILTKLSTKSAIATAIAIYSAKWKHLFTQIPNLTIRLHDSDTFSTNTIQNRVKTNFTKFMHNLLNVTQPDLPRVHRFYIKLSEVYDDDCVNQWISDLFRMNINEITIFFHNYHDGITSDAVFRSDVLTALALDRHNFREVTSSISLPNLKRLYLMKIGFQNHESLERIISACPVLENLSISYCKIQESVNVLRFSSPSVKKLQIVMTNCCCGDEMYNVVIDMPAIESIHCADCLPESYSVKNLSHAREAYIDVGPTEKQFEDEDVEHLLLNLQCVRDLVGACSKVRSLCLSSIAVVALTFSPRPLPTFHNLRKLKLGCITRTGWEHLPQFLESTPNLKVLVFKEGFSPFEGCYAEFQRNIVAEHVPRCLTFHLHAIKFELFRGVEDEINLVEYFLKNAQMLRKIKFSLSCSLSSDEISCVKSKLWSSRSHSRKLEVDFSFKVTINFSKLTLQRSSI